MWYDSKISVFCSFPLTIFCQHFSPTRVCPVLFRKMSRIKSFQLEWVCTLCTETTFGDSKTEGLLTSSVFYSRWWPPSSGLFQEFMCSNNCLRGESAARDQVYGLGTWQRPGLFICPLFTHAFIQQTFSEDLLPTRQRLQGYLQAGDRGWRPLWIRSRKV